jgi:RNA polymerase sigma factor (sigma-70 family)
VGTIDFSALVREHLKPLVLFARQWDDAAAEDLAHDAFVRLAELVRDGETPDNAVAWLYRVTRNAAIDRLRHTRQQSKHAEHLARHAAWFVTREAAGEQLDDQLDGRMLTERLRELPLEQRRQIKLPEGFGDQYGHRYAQNHISPAAFQPDQSLMSLQRELLETLH